MREHTHFAPSADRLASCTDDPAPTQGDALAWSILPFKSGTYALPPQTRNSLYQKNRAERSLQRSARQFDPAKTERASMRRDARLLLDLGGDGRSRRLLVENRIW